MNTQLSKILRTAALMVFAGALAGCVSATPPVDDCPGDSELINGECIGVDEDGNPK